MNRRELLKRLAGVPLLGALVPVAATARIYLPSRLHEADVPGQLTEQSLEDMLREIAKHPGPLTVKPTHIYVRLHEMDPATDMCKHCRATAELIEEGLEPIGCWKRPA